MPCSCKCGICIGMWVPQMYLSLFNKSVQTAGNAIITKRWNYRRHAKRSPMQTIITMWTWGFAELLSPSVGLCVLASLRLKFLFGCIRLLLLLHVFVADETVKVGLIPGNLGQRSDNKLLKKRLQHPATPHFRSYEIIFHLCCGPINNPYRVKASTVPADHVLTGLALVSMTCLPGTSAKYNQ